MSGEGGEDVEAIRGVAVSTHIVKTLEAVQKRDAAAARDAQRNRYSITIRVKEMLDSSAKVSESAPSSAAVPSGCWADHR